MVVILIGSDIAPAGKYWHQMMIALNCGDAWLQERAQLSLEQQLKIIALRHNLLAQMDDILQDRKRTIATLQVCTGPCTHTLLTSTHLICMPVPYCETCTFPKDSTIPVAETACMVLKQCLLG